MRVVILAGGSGSRLSEETVIRPKPMVEIGGRPILWHIMRHYAHYDLDEFVVALGYKGDYIKRYFTEYTHLASDLTVDLSDGSVTRTSVADRFEQWKVHLLDTGPDTGTAGRVRRMRHLLDERFMLTYGDGVADLDLRKLLRCHEESGKLVTLTAVRPPARFGALDLRDGAVQKFEEKPQMGEGWINGGFMVWEPEALDYIHGDEEFLQEPLTALARDGQLAAFEHDGFWQCMDTLRDKVFLENLWDAGSPPWKIWS